MNVLKLLKHILVGVWCKKEGKKKKKRKEL